MADRQPIYCRSTCDTSTLSALWRLNRNASSEKPDDSLPHTWWDINYRTLINLLELYFG